MLLRTMVMMQICSSTSMHSSQPTIRLPHHSPGPRRTSTNAASKAAVYHPAVILGISSVRRSVGAPHQSKRSGRVWRGGSRNGRDFRTAQAEEQESTLGVALGAIVQLRPGFLFGDERNEAKLVLNF